LSRHIFSFTNKIGHFAQGQDMIDRPVFLEYELNIAKFPLVKR
jgi:hypothetical protein